MDSSKKSQEPNHTTSEEKHVVPREAPPSYSEAMGNAPSSYRPTAPALEPTESTNPSANNNAIHPRNPYPPQGPPPVYTTSADPRFAQWDDRATRILIDSRLRMNDQFNRAKDQRERDLLWNIILIQLVDQGYTNLLLYNLIEYWQFQFYIYQSILNGLASDTSSNWQYFQPMHSVFSGSGGSGFTSDVLATDASVFHGSGPTILPTSGPGALPGSSTSYSTTFLPTPIVGPTPIVHQTSPPVSNPTVETTPTTLPNASVVQPTLAESSNVGEVPDAAESVPLLEQPSLDTGGSLAAGTNGIELSNTPVADPTLAATSLGDRVPADMLPSTDATSNLLSGLDSTGANVGSDAITSQPTLSAPQILDSQPEFSSPTFTTDDAVHSDGCCGDDDGCCGDDGGCCGDGDCCAGCDDLCAGCDDCGGGDCGDCVIS